MPKMLRIQPCRYFFTFSVPRMEQKNGNNADVNLAQLWFSSHAGGLGIAVIKLRLSDSILKLIPNVKEVAISKV